MIDRIIQAHLLDSNELNQARLMLKLDQLIKRGGDFADFYLQASSSEGWSLDEGIIKHGAFSSDCGVGLRVICKDKSFLSYSNSLTPHALDSLSDNLFIQPSSQPWVNNNSDTQQLANQLYLSNNPILNTPTHLKINLLQHINHTARAMDHVVNIIANLSLDYDEVLILRSDNKVASDIRPLIHLSVTVIVEKNNAKERGSSGLGGRYDFSNLTLELIDQHIKKAHAQALLKLEAKPAKGGQMPVVLANGWAGVILHEAVGHGLEGDFNRKGSSAFSGKIGQKVASDNVTVVDEGCINNRRGSLNIDDEGNPTQRNVLIENGILKAYMFDELNARLMGCKSSGNGRRESYAATPIPRMTNTYMENGNYDSQEIIASIENGLYAESFEGGQVDITSGQFVFNANVAWVIKNGKLDYPVKGCALTGSGPECLKYVNMVGNDSKLDDGIGVCGKAGQNVPVGVGQPTIRIDSGLVVGGVN